MSVSRPNRERTIRRARSAWWLRLIQFVLRVVRLPILTLLVVLEPVVVLVFGGLAILGLLTTLLFEAISVPHFPVLTMLSLSIGFALALALYELAIRVISD